jgi:uncharacterized protein HemX
MRQESRPPSLQIVDDAMTTHAVKVAGRLETTTSGRESNTSGTVPLWRRDTAPSEHESTNDPCPPGQLSAAGRDGFTETEPDVARTPREGAGRREWPTSDATKLNLPILIVIALISGVTTAALSASGVYWMLRLTTQQQQFEIRETQMQMQSDIRSISERLEQNIKNQDRERDAARDKAASDERVREMLLKQYEQSNTEFQKKMLGRPR